MGNPEGRNKTFEGYFKEQPNLGRDKEGGGGRRMREEEKERPAETTSYSYVQFAPRELCSAAQGASTGDDSRGRRTREGGRSSALLTEYSFDNVRQIRKPL